MKEKRPNQWNEIPCEFKDNNNSTYQLNIYTCRTSNNTKLIV